MSTRRLFSADVVTSDDFVDLPPLAQCLYIQICLDADDDGFSAKTRGLCRMLGATDQDLQALIDAGYVYRFPSGIVVDMYWGVNNSIRKDRYKPTTHKEEAAMLDKDEDGKYFLKNQPDQESASNASIIPEDNLGGKGLGPALEAAVPDCQPSDNQLTTSCQPSDNQLTTSCQPTVVTWLPQVKLSEDRISKGIGAHSYSRSKYIHKQTSEEEEVNQNSAPEKPETLSEDEDIKKALQYFQDCIRPIARQEDVDRIRDMVQTEGLPNFLQAVDITKKRGGRSLNYVETVIKDPRPQSRAPDKKKAGFDEATRILESGEIDGIFD